MQLIRSFLGCLKGSSTRCRPYDGMVGLALSQYRTELGAAPDCLQRPLRSRFWVGLSGNVRQMLSEPCLQREAIRRNTA